LGDPFACLLPGLGSKSIVGLKLKSFFIFI
jgi:hypothetical protein